MKILAMDQATNRTGVAIIENKDLLSHYVVDKSHIKDVPLRIKEMFIDLVRIINDQQPDILILEGVQRQQNEKTMLMLSQFGGMLVGFAYLNNLDVTVYLPTEWRKLLGFHQGPGTKRDDLKAQGIDFVQKTYGVLVSDDEADAICLGYTATIL